MSTAIDYKALFALAEQEHENYSSAEPFPHTIFDDAFSTALVESLRQAVPTPDDAVPWRKIHVKHPGGDMQIGKLGLSNDADLPHVIRNFIHELYSAPFLAFLEKLTGIDNLIPDPRLRGGGIHQVLRGGKLGVHADFTRHQVYQIDRRLNLLLFLNPDWRDEYAGHLELWSRNMQHCVKSIRPRFGRCVVFNTDTDSFHGHPQSLDCPAELTRKSIALYYYTQGREDHKVAPTSATDWQVTGKEARPDHE